MALIITATITACLIIGIIRIAVSRPYVEPLEGKTFTLDTAHDWWTESQRLNPGTSRTFGGYVDLLKSIGFRIY